MRALHWMALATLLQPCLQGCAREQEKSEARVEPPDTLATLTSAQDGEYDVIGGCDFSGQSAMKLIKRIRWKEPVYPPEALAQRVEGTVIAKCVITVEGLVNDCQVIKSLPSLDAAALDSILSSRYEPILFNGKPVEVHYSFAIHFRLPRPDAGTSQERAEEAVKVPR